MEKNGGELVFLGTSDSMIERFFNYLPLVPVERL